LPQSSISTAASPTALEEKQTMTRHNSLRVLLLVLILGLALATAGHAGLKVDVLYDIKADFTAYQTYAWESGPRNNSPMETMIDQRVKEATEKELASKGLRLVTGSEEPDMLLTYHGGIEDNLLIEGVRYEIAPHVVWTGASAMSATRNYQVGSLILDMADAKTRKVVWSGVVTGKAGTGNQLREKLEKAVKKVLRQFPPR
jgi:hypothetical protein